MTNSVTAALEYLRKSDLETIRKDMVPELHDLLKTWDSLDWKTRGEKTGFVLGKYGIEIFGVKAFKNYREMRQANAACNLEALCYPSTRAELIQAANKVELARQQFAQMVRILPDQQGKHIFGHKNHVQQVKNGERIGVKPSILTHSDPEVLLKKYAGTGMPRGQSNLGVSGFKETIVCDEIIGEWFHPDTKQYLPTRRATIHYDKDGGAHIVPSNPNPIVGSKK